MDNLKSMGIPPTHNDVPEIYNHGIQGETKESATLFWNLFNRILQEVTNDVVWDQGQGHSTVLPKQGQGHSTIHANPLQ